MVSSSTLRVRAITAASLSIAFTALGTAAATTGPAGAVPPDCGVHLLPSLDPTGTHLTGEVLDLTEDGVYVGSAHDAAGLEHAAYWIDGVAHRVPVPLEDGDLLDVTEGHLAVGDGWDPQLERWRGYVFDIDTGEVSWLPGIGGDWASARRVNEHGVAVGDGGAANGTGHPLRWRPPYASAERLPKLGGSAERSGAWAAGNNDHGDVVGSTLRGRLTPDKRNYGGVDARFHVPVTHVVTWDPQPERLDEAGPMSHAFDVNNSGRAVGFADIDALGYTMPAYWSLDDEEVHVMGSPVPGTDRATAYGVSEGGWAAGAAETFVSDDEVLFHAFVWTGAGEQLMLPGAGNSWDEIDSIAHGVSDVRDEVTGRSEVGGVDRPTVWRCASLIGAALTAVSARGSSQAAADPIVVTTTIQAAVDAADPGDTVLVPDGTYVETVHVTEPGITIRGSRDAVLDGTGRNLSFGIRVRSLDGTRLDGFTLDGLTVRGYTRSGVQLSGVDHFRLTGTSYVDNPLYGLFPVRTSHGRVDHNEVSGSLDSGVYVGQSTDLVVDHNIAHHNTIGLEVELSSRVVVEDNVSTDNTVGAVVQILPGRDVKVTDDVLVRRNVLSGNNQPNAVTGPSLVGRLPSGIGILNMAGDHVRIIDNTVAGNRSGGIGVISLLPELAAADSALDPAPDGGEVRGNVARGNGRDPDPRLALLGLPGVDVFWDLTGSPCFEVPRTTRTFPRVLPSCG